MALPPVEAGAVKDTVAVVFPATAVTPVGAPGAVTAAVGVTLLEGVEARPVPIALVAVTVALSGTPLVSPVTVIGLAVPVPVRPPGLAVTV